MEEDAKEHDIDQRHGGPDRHETAGHQETADHHASTGRVSLQIPRRRSNNTVSRDGAISPLEMKDRSKSMPDHERQRSRQTMSPPGRHSTETSQVPRASRDFDNRFDGPFGRPSLTMNRRRSSQNQTLNPTERPSEPTLSTSPEDAGPEHQINNFAPSLQTTQSINDSAFEPEPPPLNYSLRTRKWSIVFFWSLIVIDCTAMPLGLYFGLWYGLTRQTLSANAVFSIVTAALGGVSIIEYFLRFYRLWRKESTCRVIGARRAYLDWFHWNFSFGWVIIMIELIVGTIPANPPIRLLAMPLSSMLFAFGTQLMVMDIARYFKVPAPVRISSIPKGAQLRPGIYSIIEDVCAVDGSGGTAFREALNKRYEASHVFRAMLRRLGIFWALGAQAAATVTTILVFTVHNNIVTHVSGTRIEGQGAAAYVIGWTLPFVWAGIWTLATFWYVKRELRREQTAWTVEVAAKSQV